MKKIIVLICLIFLITGCNKQTITNDNLVSKKTEETMYERDTIQNNTEIIDCYNIEECMNISNKIQLELPNTIENVYYLEVKKDDKLLGYNIKYNFKDYQYNDYETCKEKEKILDENISNKVMKHECNEEGLLTVIGDDND